MTDHYFKLVNVEVDKVLLDIDTCHYPFSSDIIGMEGAWTRMGTSAWPFTKMFGCSYYFIDLV